jgi:UPF0042 nucleotide-binding protein
MGMRLILITGLSGAGKSVALKALEDASYFAVDNLPAPLLPQITHLLSQDGYRHMAVSVDTRSASTLAELPAHVQSLRQQGVDVRLIFLEARADVLVKRFSETRRRHPLGQGQLTIPECIQLERELLTPLLYLGHRIDTSEFSANALRAWVRQMVLLDPSRMTLIFESFGYKHGIPLDADFVFDVRCLPNPYYDPELRPFHGKQQPVIDFLAAEESVDAMYLDIKSFIASWLPNFVQDNRNYLTVAIGCTGGQHRSVYLVEKMAAAFTGQHPVIVRHRELPEPI